MVGSFPGVLFLVFRWCTLGLFLIVLLPVGLVEVGIGGEVVTRGKPSAPSVLVGSSGSSIVEVGWADVNSGRALVAKLRSISASLSSIFTFLLFSNLEMGSTSS